MIIHDNGWMLLNVVVEKIATKVVDLKVKGKLVKEEDGSVVKQVVEYVEKEVIAPTKFIKDGITLVGNEINSKYRVLKTKSTIFDKYTGKTYTVKHRPEEISAVLEQKNYIGFKVGNQKNEVYRRKP